MRILAIDPGYDRLGIAILEGDPSRPTYIWSACIEPPPGTQERRLAAIYDAIVEAVRAHDPEAFAIETLFFSANRRTALKVAEARGTVLSLAGRYRLPVIECSPQQVKLAVTGDGRADKKAVARMIPRLLRLPAARRRDDELDAIAIGIAALAMGFPHPS